MRSEYYNLPVTRIDKSALAFHNRYFAMFFLNAPGVNEPMDTMLGKPVPLVQSKHCPKSLVDNIANAPIFFEIPVKY